MVLGLLATLATALSLSAPIEYAGVVAVQGAAVRARAQGDRKGAPPPCTPRA